MCSDNQHFQNEFKHLNKIFTDINGYPTCIIEQTIEKVKNLNQMPWSTQVTTKIGKKPKICCYPVKVK